jgi:ligand-binding SRPBCC domain-containing protein
VLLPGVELSTRIHAPVERVFDLARTVEVHERSMQSTDERAVGGVTEGLLGPNDRVTWRARHLGLPLELTVEITGFDRPRWFRDQQVEGPFAEMIHDHRFERDRGATVMTDEFYFRAPFGLLGKLAGSLVLESYMEWLLRERAAHLKEIAESAEWKRYLPAESP